MKRHSKSGTIPSSKPSAEPEASNDAKVSDDEADAEVGGASTSPMDDDASASLKRKRPDEIDSEGLLNGSADASPSKRQKSTPPPPPPPPPDPDPDVETPKLDEGEGNGDNETPPPPPPPPKDPNSNSPGEYPAEMEGVQKSGVEVQQV